MQETDINTGIKRLEAAKSFIPRDQFLKERIKLFGDFEDAVTDKSHTVFHSALSPLINLGLITDNLPNKIFCWFPPLNKSIAFSKSGG